MGMFDEIRVEQILPGNTEIINEWYQTKSFDNVMAKYVITAKGELYVDNIIIVCWCNCRSLCWCFCICGCIRRGSSVVCIS